MKIHSKKYLIENSSGILSSVHDKLNEISLEGTSTPDFKEGMVVYFSSLPLKVLQSVENKLKSPDKNIVLSLPKPSDKNYYGGKSYSLVNTAIKKLSKNRIDDGKEVQLFSNALSIAKYIQSIYKRPVQADRGTQFRQLRNKAVELVRNVEPKFPRFADKWCPADIYIYNDTESVNVAMSAEYLKIGDDSFNAQFQDDMKKTNVGILGISLKEEKAQAGAGGSFEKILTREENYKESKRITNYSVLSVAYHYEKSLSSTSVSTKLKELSTAHASAVTLLSKNTPGAKEVADELEKSLKMSLGKYLPKKDKDRFPKKAIELAFQESKISEVKYSKNLRDSVRTMFTQVRKRVNNEYNRMRDEFFTDLQNSGFKTPSVKLNPSNMGITYVLGKAGCYKAASYVLSGLNSDVLTIPKEFKNIMKQKNAFVALTAYAVGLAGISPTFFKLTGSSVLGGTAHVDTFYSDGFLNLDKGSDIEVIDEPTRMGFAVKFLAKVTVKNSGKSDTVKKYSVVINFQSAGESITINVQEFKGK